jgi:hypothetical protein
MPKKRSAAIARDRNGSGLEIVKQSGKMSRGSGKTASKTVHPDMCHDPVFYRSNLGCYLWILLPKSEGVIL